MKGSVKGLIKFMGVLPSTHRMNVSAVDPSTPLPFTLHSFKNMQDRDTLIEQSVKVKCSNRTVTTYNSYYRESSTIVEYEN